MGKRESLESLVMAAAKGEPLPIGADLHDKILYEGLRTLYELYSIGWVTKEEGARKKQQLIIEWEVARRRHYIKRCGLLPKIGNVNNREESGYEMPQVQGRC